MPKDFYFIRHGLSEANKAQIMCGGGVDTPLAPEGIAQAEKMRDVLQTIKLPKKPDIIIHTGLNRTLHTANIINEALSLPYYIEKDLKEHLVGDWEGMTWLKVEKFFLDKQDPPGGETYIEFKNRISKAFDHIIHKFNMPLIVAHGGVWKVLMDHFMHPKPDLINNAELYYLEYQGQKAGFAWDIHAVNDNS